jgi:hypothetical protein
LGDLEHNPHFASEISIFWASKSVEIASFTYQIPVLIFIYNADQTANTDEHRSLILIFSFGKLICKGIYISARVKKRYFMRVG